MFTRMLLPLDGTKRAEDALPVARELALETNARVMLLHVSAPNAATLQELAISHQVEIAAHELDAAGVSAQVLTAGGGGTQGVANAISTVVDRNEIDLIVLSPEAHSLLDGLRHPSVTAQVLAQSAAPVLIVPMAPRGHAPRAAQPRLLEYSDTQVIVPLDGSPLAERALPMALRLARQYKRSLLLVRALPPVQPLATGFETYALTRDAADNDLRVAREYLGAVRARLQKTEHVDVHTMMLEGIPAEALLALTESKPGSVVVMSTHGRTGLARLLLGSVTLAVARKTTIPLMIVPTLVRDTIEVTQLKPEGAKGAVIR